jgi:hypothetical protein
MTSLPWKHACLGLALSMLQGCGSQTAVEVPRGRWGGDAIELLVMPNGGTVRFCCATGAINEALIPDASGHFEANGTYTFETGPLPVAGNRPLPAHYSGSVDGPTMTLTVSTPSETMGPFTLVFGELGSLRNCVCPL